MSTKKVFAKPTASGKIRGCDPSGCGHFGASRGARTHQGEDYLVAPGDPVLSPISGKVTRIAYPYANDLSYKGIEIVNDSYTVKIFYMSPSVAIGSRVEAGDQIGIAQNIAAKYTKPMGNHIHVEMRRGGILVKPSDLIQ